MTFGTWRAPFPLRFGGGGHTLISAMVDLIRAGRPAALRGEDGTDVELENRAMARMLAAAWRSTSRRVAQRDPRALTELQRPVTFPDGTTRTCSLLERWERILGLVPAPDASARQRRAAVHAALVGQASAKRSAIETAMQAIFGSWYRGLRENRVADVHYPGRVPEGTVHAYWPGPGTAQYPGETSSTWPWRSALCQVSVQFQPPANTSQREVDARIAQATRVLDAQLPAWMTFFFSQWGPTQTTAGFFAGVSVAGTAC